MRKVPFGWKLGTEEDASSFVKHVIRHSSNGFPGFLSSALGTFLDLRLHSSEHQKTEVQIKGAVPAVLGGFAF